ncbi:density-regulated protein DRP1 [Zopfochytrium polystomum]|nr:density-regulated protein DRP1 [Zopfochytrium polystomum]
MGDTEVDSAPRPTTRVVTDILYCPSTYFWQRMIAAFCEFGPSAKRCRAWLTQNHPSLVASCWGEAAPAPAEGSSSGTATTGLEGSAASLSIASDAPDGAKADEKKPEKLDALQKEELKKEKKRKEARISIKRVERTKRKCTITVAGLEVFDVDLKKAAKLFATKFACGSSVTKNPAGFDEIVVQGDVQDEIYELIRKTWKQIPEDNIDMD